MQCYMRCCFYHPPLAAAPSLLGRRLGWKDCCCCWLWLDLLATSRMLCSVAASDVMLLTVPDLAGQKTTGMEKSGPTPSAFRRACRPCGSGNGGAPAAAADCHSCWTTAGHTYVWVFICLLLVSECAPNRRRPRTGAALLPRSLWKAGRGAAGKRDPCAVSFPLGSCSGGGLGWKDCCCWLDLPATLRMFCSVAVSGVMLPTVPDLAEKRRTPGMERSGPTPSAFRRAGWRLALLDYKGRAPAAAAAEHDRCWTAGHMHVLVCISLFSTPLATDFGPGPEAAAEGQLDGEFAQALYVSRPRLRAWPRGGGGGASSWPGSLLATPLAADFGPGLARRRRWRGAQRDGEFALKASLH